MTPDELSKKVVELAKSLYGSCGEKGTTEIVVEYIKSITKDQPVKTPWNQPVPVPEEMLGFQEQFKTAAEKAIAHVAAHREEIIQAFVAKTGVQPNEAVLCEQRMVNGETRLWVRRKGEMEKMIDRKNLGARIWIIISRAGLPVIGEGFFTDETTARFRIDVLGKTNELDVLFLDKKFHGEPDSLEHVKAPVWVLRKPHYEAEGMAPFKEFTIAENAGYFLSEEDASVYAERHGLALIPHKLPFCS